MPSRVESIPNSTNQSSGTGSNITADDFEDPAFDPVTFLNDLIPSVNLSASQATAKSSRSSQVQEAVTHVQELLTKVNTHNIRCSDALTQLTDEILRSGSRLAYEVEILRGNANGLYEVLTETLQVDIRKFIHEEATITASGPADEVERSDVTASGEAVAHQNYGALSKDPEFISQLRMLGRVKAQLEAVIGVFGEAMKWPMPNSELSMSLSLISVSAPELGMENSDQDDKARAVAKKLRSEVVVLLDSDGGGYQGLEAATERVEQLRTLVSVWKGTAEERARTRFVDGLIKLVEDRKKSLEARSVPLRVRADSSSQRSSSMPGRPTGTGSARPDRAPVESSNPAAGLFRNLQKLRGEIYLD